MRRSEKDEKDGTTTSLILLRQRYVGNLGFPTGGRRFGRVYEWRADLCRNDGESEGRGGRTRDRSVPDSLPRRRQSMGIFGDGLAGRRGRRPGAPVRVWRSVRRRGVRVSSDRLVGGSNGSLSGSKRGVRESSDRPAGGSDESDSWFEGGELVRALTALVAGSIRRAAAWV